MLLSSVTIRRIAAGGAALAAQVPPSQGPIPIVTRRFVRAAHSLGIAVHVWTIDDPDEMNRLLDLGVDGIMSDDTRTLRRVLRDREAWSGLPGND